MGLPAGGQPGRLDIAELPRNQYTDKQQNRKADPKCQRMSHPVPGPIAAFRISTPSHHVYQGYSQTADNRDKRKRYEDFHGEHYPVNRYGLGWRFWLVTAAAVSAVAVTSALGLWQLDRAAQKTRLQTAIESRQTQPAVDQFVLRSAPSQDLQHRRAVLRGTWLPESTVFLDNRQMNGRPGFYVVTALKIADSSEAVLVQRGWVPRNFVDRTALPAVATPPGPVVVEGRVTSGPSRLYELSPAQSGPIRQNLDIDAYAAEIRWPLLPLAILETSAQPDGLLRQWPVVGTGVEKHHGYAAQWFGLASLIAVLYVWFQIVRRIHTRPPTP